MRSKYKICRKLGQGGFGTVRIGTNCKNRRRFAIKALPKSTDQGLIDAELRINRTVRHVSDGALKVVQRPPSDRRHQRYIAEYVEDFESRDGHCESSIRR